MRSALFGGMAVTFGLFGCMGSSQMTPRTYQEGDANGRPRMESLPSLDVDPSELTAEMRMARLLSAECLNLAAPARPTDTSTSAIAAWSEQELQGWMRRKHERAEAARRELDVAAEQNHRQRIMAGAIVGLVYEDVARTLLSMPVPSELSAEPEIAEMYAELLYTNAAPYVQLAQRAYTACAGNARQLEPLSHWSEFCRERSGHLSVPAVEHSKLGAKETSVSIVRR